MGYNYLLVGSNHLAWIVLVFACFLTWIIIRKRRSKGEPYYPPHRLPHRPHSPTVKTTTESSFTEHPELKEVSPKPPEPPESKEIPKNTYELKEEEKKIIQDIYNEIRVLSGLLIPKCDSNTFEIVITLRKQGKETINLYLDGRATFLDTKANIMEIIDELLVVEDVLRAIDRRVSFYDFLGLQPNKNLNGEVKTAYRGIVKKIHPDTHPGDKYFEFLTQKVITAYATLSKPHLKEIYDKELGLK
ncbi:MAG: DnaJ domain-containing protein [Candidatus Yanofskybacteria bacterium]|nr:DnaJ domain-containing protein [Candidatus Yanofskybacteria bacterium]